MVGRRTRIPVVVYPSARLVDRVLVQCSGLFLVPSAVKLARRVGRGGEPESEGCG